MSKKTTKSTGQRAKLTYRIIQVPMDAGLLDAVDAAAGRVAESRAAYIRAACEERVRRETSEALDRRYAEAYRRQPEKLAWGKIGAKLLARRLRDDT
ncbi:MAG TPA: hypothetical protein VMQ51_16480 [Candidatus Binatia bacterium]|nr:hypothetical protein [Candidatus Binatia bacterium]